MREEVLKGTVNVNVNRLLNPLKGGPITTAMEPRGHDYSRLQTYRGGILEEIPDMEATAEELMKIPPSPDNISKIHLTISNY